MSIVLTQVYEFCLYRELDKMYAHVDFANLYRIPPHLTVIFNNLVFLIIIAETGYKVLYQKVCSIYEH